MLATKGSPPRSKHSNSARTGGCAFELKDSMALLRENFGDFVRNTRGYSCVPVEVVLAN